MAAPQALNLSGWALPLVALLLGVLLGARLTERLPGAVKATLQGQPRQHRREGGDGELGQQLHDGAHLPPVGCLYSLLPALQ